MAADTLVRIFVWFIACSVAGSPVAGFAQHASRQNVSVSARLSEDNVTPGSQVGAVLTVNITEGWHINSSSPSDENLIATSVRLDDTTKATILDVRYPPTVEREFGFADQPLEVYEGRIEILLRLGIREDAKPKAYILPIVFRYQACSTTICLAPATARTELTVHVVGQKDTRKPD